MKTLIKKIYFFIFPDKRRIKELLIENKKLSNEVAYFKNHCDIKTLKPATGYLRTYQLENLNFSIKIINLLIEKINISPFLEGGALLGYYRHNGYIPWDDDLDFGLLRTDFDKLINYCKENFIWYDTHEIKENSYLVFDNVIKSHPNKYIAIKTPYCLHIYFGTDIKSSFNAEFFPWDFVSENISKNDFISFSKSYSNELKKLHTWEKIYKYIESSELFNTVFCNQSTKFLSPGIGHWDLAKQTIRGYHNYYDIFPLKNITFEGVNLMIPNNPEKYLELAYGNYMDFPNDFGISHNFKEINEELENN